MITFLNSRHRQLFNGEYTIQGQTRIKILLICLLGFLSLTSILCVFYFFVGSNFLFYRAITLFILFIICLGLLFSRLSFKIPAHLLMFCISATVWSNIFFLRQELNIGTVQSTFLVLSISYYVLGLRWGIIYSLANILPVIGSIIMVNLFKYDLPTQHIIINEYSYTTGIILNFILLLYIHYAFFKALSKSNLKEQKLKKNLKKIVKESREMAASKTNFLNTMSHELRTPLNAVVGIANLLLMENPKGEQLHDLNILLFSAESLMDTINNILEFNQIDKKSITLEKNTFHLAELSDTVCEAFKPRAKEKHLIFDCNVDHQINSLRITGDYARLNQILFILVGNAIKYTLKGFVKLKVSIIELHPDHVKLHFSITDSGIGIPDEIKPGLYNPFATSQYHISSQYQGNLAINIANGLVELHGSKLKFNSVEGSGTTFQFDISYPVQEIIAETLEQELPVAKDIIGLRVLIADDEKINVLVIKRIMEKWGIITDVAENGQQAVDLVRTKDFDVILMDINMPVMNGFDASKLIKGLKDPKKSGIPIIAVTASVGAAMEEVDQYPFIDDCILKPFKPDDLKQKLENIIR